MQDSKTSPSGLDIDLNEKVKQLQDQLLDAERARSRAEERLEKYQSAASGANDGLWEWDVINNETFVSEPWKTMLGYDADAEFDSDAWVQLLHPEDKEHAIQNFDNFIIGKKLIYNQEFRLQHKNGNYRWINSKAKAVRDGSGKATIISGSHTDITDRKGNVESIKKSEVKYRNLFENSLVAMFRINAETGEIIEANSKLKSMLKIEDHKERSFYSFFASNREANKFIEGLKGGENTDDMEIQLITAHEDTLWFSFSGIYYQEENEIDCVLKDITQTKENLLELQKVNFELDSFVYHASHDLRSPLRSVLGLIDLYRMENNVGIKEECIEKIESSIKRLDHLVMDLLSISRNDRVNEQLREIIFMNEINNSITSYYNASNTKNMEILTRVRQPVKFISDMTRVRIILNNLISNAIKYRSFSKEKSLITIEVEVNEKEAVVKVEDNGEGIEESKLPNIFDMFYRATEKSEGSGLGLYIVKKVADKLKAKIEVESLEMEGTTFTFTIPNFINKPEGNVS
ncbi:MAG: ATP-binding protein [Candidatus Cyclobacteriaceae bacterium M2_1C_046]